MVDHNDGFFVMLMVRPGSLRNGLLALLKSIPGIVTIETAESSESGMINFVKQKPQLVIFEADGSYDRLSFLLGSIKSKFPAACCILIAENQPDPVTIADLQIDAIIQQGAHPDELVILIEKLISEVNQKKGE